MLRDTFKEVAVSGYVLCIHICAGLAFWFMYLDYKGLLCQTIIQQHLQLPFGFK